MRNRGGKGDALELRAVEWHGVAFGQVLKMVVELFGRRRVFEGAHERIWKEFWRLMFPSRDD